MSRRGRRWNPETRPLIVGGGGKEPKAYLVLAQPWERNLPVTEALVLGLFDTEAEAKERSQGWIEEHPAGWALVFALPDSVRYGYIGRDLMEAARSGNLGDS